MNRSAMALARSLVEHVTAAGVVDVELLTLDPAEAIGSDSSVEVTWVPADRLPADCSIAATYDWQTSPAQIKVAQDASPGRRRFSLLHEYGHHLRDQDLDVMTALFAAGRRSGELEERMCDAFASLVLMPLQVRESAFGRGVTARGVADLIATSRASAQAVAVAAAESLNLPGYVLLVNRSGECVFAARCGDVYPVRRGAAQEGLLARAGAGPALRGIARVSVGTGSRTSELNIESAPLRNGAVVVAVDGPLPGMPFSGGRAGFANPTEGWCDECTAAFSSFAAGCEECGDPRCPSCGSCSCPTRPVAGERVCPECHDLLPPAAFPTPAARVCSGCA